MLKKFILLLVLCQALTAMAAPPQILVVGDSLSAAYGIDLDAGWVNLLQTRLQKAGFPHQLINASVSGDTTRNGRARLPAALAAHQPVVVIIELGGNDGLRGLSLKVMRDNLQFMIEAAQAAGAKVLLLEIQIPPSYGAAYVQAFRQVYADLAKRYDLPLAPFLQDVGDHPELMQADGIHANVQGQQGLLNNVYPQLLPLLDKPE